jgi:protein-S-isoprenylcysteine O-methyltransferase Ste14
MKKRIRIQGTLIFFVVLISILLSKFVFIHWRSESTDEYLDALGIGLVLSGFLFRIVARGYKEEKSYGGKNLVKDGPYHLMRHPMYFGTLLIGMGIISALFKLWTFPLFLIIYYLIYAPQIQKEEDTLSCRFGEEYKNYCKITPKYFPKVHSLLKPRDYISLKLSWIKKELSSLIMVMVTIIAVEIWQDIKSFGHKEFLKEPLELFLVITLFVIVIILFAKRGKSSF